MSGLNRFMHGVGYRYPKDPYSANEECMLRVCDGIIHVLNRF